MFKYAGCADIKDTENGKTLAELRFKHNESMTAYRKNVFNTVKVPLLNLDKTDICERAIYIFTQIFNTFSDPIDPSDP